MSYECHGHIILSGRDFTNAIRQHQSGVLTAVIDSRLAQYARAGVTFFRDGGDNMGACVYAKRAAPAYGIDYRTPCFAIHKAGCYGKALGRAFSDPGEFRALVDEAADAGADFIKLMVTGIMDFHTYGVLTPGALTMEELVFCVDYCHGLGLRVMAHCNGAEHIKNALASGCDSLEHGYYIDEEGIRLLAETGAVWVPTVTPVANLLGNSTFSDAILERIVRGHYDALHRAHDLGCLVACGSDAGSGSVFPDTCTAQELDYLTDHTPYTAEDLQRGALAVADRFCRK